MDVYLIKASAPGPFKEYKKAMGAPPQNIFSLAAATPAGIGITMCDETIGMKPKASVKADLIAILFHTPDAVHAYEMADRYRAKGKTVVLGGLHPSALPHEAQQHCDAVLAGEAEGIWKQLIDDFRNQHLQPFYKRETPVDLADVKPYPIDIIPPSKYGHVWSVLVSRGCVHRCEFCAVPPFFSGKYRLRPIDHIIAEISAAPTDWFELHADNLTADREYALKLFKALKPLNINWYGESTIKMADDEELLRAAAESGCRELLIGIETSSKGALTASGKGFVDPDTTREKLSQFHAHGIKVISPIIFGFDSHTPDIFRESEEFCRHIGIDEVEPVLLIPFPGTPLHERLDRENRILSRDWSLYDGSNAVFQPANMTPEELEQGSNWFWEIIREKNRSASALRGSATPSPEHLISTGTASARGPALSTGGTPVRWKSILALIVIGIGIYFNWYWIWGMLVIIWALTDLRSRHTYLLENIPRSESPVLYWIVVLMWLFLGLWALSTSPLVTGMMNSALLGTVAPIAKNNVYADQKSRQSLKSVENSRFDFTLQAPENWKISEQSDPNSVSIHIQEQHDMASVTAIAVDYQMSISLKAFIGDMEKALQIDLPFAIEAALFGPVTTMILDTSGTRMHIRRYKGTYQGYEVTASIGYAVKKHIGYALVGVFEKTDPAMETAVNKAMGSFNLAGS